MNIESVVKAYNRYSSSYDAIFGLFFSPGRKQVIKNMELNDGDHVLEVGIGTGASLRLPQKLRFGGYNKC